MESRNRSFIYQDINIYRAILNLLYLGRYRTRFRRVEAILGPSDKSVVELCFGDIHIADFCKKTGRSWTGFDLSEAFVRHAIARGHDAKHADILEPGSLPVCDVCVMMGSLYHFAHTLPELFGRVRACSRGFIISEPVRNWTNSHGPARLLAKLFTRAGHGDEDFRYDERSLLCALDELKRTIQFEYRIISLDRDIVLEIIWSK